MPADEQCLAFADTARLMRQSDYRRHAHTPGTRSVSRTGIRFLPNHDPSLGEPAGFDPCRQPDGPRRHAMRDIVLRLDSDGLGAGLSASALVLVVAFVSGRRGVAEGADRAACSGSGNGRGRLTRRRDLRLRGVLCGGLRHRLIVANLANLLVVGPQVFPERCVRSPVLVRS